MKYILVWILIVGTLFGAKVKALQWKEGQTFFEYLKAKNIPLDVLSDVSSDDKKFLSKISSKQAFYELKDENGTLLQALIPISEVMQIHLSRAKTSKKYLFDIIPIEYETDEYFGKITLSNNPYTDVLNAVQSKKVARRLSSALNGVIDGKKLHKGDEIDFIYTQRLRAGKPYSKPDIRIIRLMAAGKEKFIYVDENGEGHTQEHKSVPYTTTEKRKVIYSKQVPVSREDSLFGMPLRHVRVTSNFSHSRWHPILHLYRPHHGTDFGARRGTPLLAVNSGRVTFAGPMGTYGNVVKIKHGEGYESLYAHQSSIRVRVGETVKRGQIIGYVGSTGRSTGPHLHFGLMKNGKWIDPMTVLNKVSLKMFKSKKFVKYENINIIKFKTVALKNVKQNRSKILKYIHNNTSTYKWNEYDAE